MPNIISFFLDTLVCGILVLLRPGKSSHILLLVLSTGFTKFGFFGIPTLVRLTLAAKFCTSIYLRLISVAYWIPNVQSEN